MIYTVKRGNLTSRLEPLVDHIFTKGVTQKGSSGQRARSRTVVRVKQATFSRRVGMSPEGKSVSTLVAFIAWSQTIFKSLITFFTLLPSR